MNFEQTLRQKIAASPYGSTERNILKVVLGELQLKASSGKIVDETAHGIVKKMIKDNSDNIKLLGTEDARRPVFERENEILSGLLPTYLTADQIRLKLHEGGLDEQIKTAKNGGQAVGLAMKLLKEQQAPVEGDTVRQVVDSIRSA